MFEWLKRLFSKPALVADTQPTPVSNTEKMSIKPCKSCGKPISYDPSWQHIPNYCPECKAKYRAEHEKQKMVKRRCRSCGRTFTFPSTVKHYPNYCRECRSKFKEQKGYPLFPAARPHRCGWKRRNRQMRLSRRGRLTIQ